MRTARPKPDAAASLEIPVFKEIAGGLPPKPDESAISPEEIVDILSPEDLQRELRTVAEHVAFQRRLVASIKHKVWLASVRYKQEIDSLQAELVKANRNLDKLTQLRMQLYNHKKVFYKVRKNGDQDGPEHQETPGERQP